MTPQSGQMLSHYLLVEKIGEGGMGQVYRAEDTKLGRSVALRVLPAAFVQDGARLAGHTSPFLGTRLSYRRQGLFLPALPFSFASRYFCGKRLEFRAPVVPKL